MKLESFKSQLRQDVAAICRDKNWKYDENKHRGMAFEDWCFNFLSDMYPDSDNRAVDCILRQDDFNIDIVFPSKEFEEIYYIQAKFDKPSASEPINVDQVGTFFTAYEYLYLKRSTQIDKIQNPRVVQLFNEADAWNKQQFKVHFIFISTGQSTAETEQKISEYSELYKGDHVSFDVWDIRKLRDEYVRANSIDERYPDQVKIQLGEGKFLKVDGPEKHLTFVVAGSKLAEIFAMHKQSLFNWNIRSFLGRKGQVNNGMATTIKESPDTFYYLNNGISALCESFDFDEVSRSLTINKLQVVNGAQTLGAIGSVSTHSLSNLQVLVKLTSIKRAAREVGLAAQIIRANNTQNSLRVPDFRSNDPIQLWLEQKIKDLKPKGDLGKLVYGRKRPYPSTKTGQTVIKMLEFGKVRYAWEFEPRLPISAPNKLFLHKENNGVYEDAFGEQGKLVDIWSDNVFNEVILALHCFHKCGSAIDSWENESFDIEISGENKVMLYAQLSRLKFYGLHCMKIFADEHLDSLEDIERNELFAYGKKFDRFCEVSFKAIKPALQKSYRDIIQSKEGAAFALPRDGKIWNSIKDNFNDYCNVLKSSN